ncbi:hypothetical protein ACHQM5_025595 [Ranunculus cassubicifolius]
MIHILYQLFVLLLVGHARAKVPAVIVFGDSSVDAGNNNYIRTIGRSNWPPYGRDFEGGKPTGRFCNGRLTTDFISEAFGIKPVLPAYLDPSFSIKDFATGVTFASAGTGLDNVTSEQISVIPLWKELIYFHRYKRDLIKYMGENNTANTLGEAVYISSIGTNDFLVNYYQLPSTRAKYTTVEEYQDFLVGLMGDFVSNIYRAGARKIALTGLPPFGCLPFVRSTNFMQGQVCREDYNKVASDYNAKLSSSVPKLNAKFSGIKVVYSDVYDILADAIEKPFKYGFEEVALGCCGAGGFEMGLSCNNLNPITCTDASKYIFWDAIHPTEKMNSILSDSTMKTSLSAFL